MGRAGGDNRTVLALPRLQLGTSIAEAFLNTRPGPRTVCRLDVQRAPGRYAHEQAKLKASLAAQRRRLCAVAFSGLSSDVPPCTNSP